MTKLNQWTFQKKQTSKFEPGKSNTIRFDYTTLETHNVYMDWPKCIMAVDPGKNFGLVLLGKGMCHIYNGVLDDRLGTPLRDVAFHYAYNMAKIYKPDLGIIEGASYNDRFGQVKLAEIRCGFALGMSEYGVPVEIVAPKTPRKAVFGSGDTGAWDVWVGLNHNAADALCLALYPIFKESK